MSQLKSVCTAVAMLVGATSLVSYGSPVTWEYTGVVTEVTRSEAPWDSGLAVGSVLTGTFTFESTATSSDPTLVIGRYRDSIVGASGSLGGVSFSGPVGTANGINILNDFDLFGGLVDNYTASMGVTASGIAQQFVINLRADSLALFSDGTLLLDPPSLGLLDPSLTGFTLGPVGLPSIVTGDLTSLARVPEPSVLAFLLVGILPLGLKRGLRRAKAAG